MQDRSFHHQAIGETSELVLVLGARDLVVRGKTMSALGVKD